MHRAYSHSFRTATGLLVYVPTEHGRAQGRDIVQLVLDRWKPPRHFFHFRRGGHVAACRYHRAGPLFARMDIRSFFDSVTRTKVHRMLRRLGVPQEKAFSVAQASTVERLHEPGKYALPFGFVQSMVLASAALDRSQTGTCLRAGSRYGVRVSVYVDDVLLSAGTRQQLDEFMADLVKAAGGSGYRFNTSKMSLPGEVAEAFNIVVSKGEIRVNLARMAEFEAIVRTGERQTAAAVMHYVQTVNRGQASELATVPGKI